MQVFKYKKTVVFCSLAMLLMGTTHLASADMQGTLNQMFVSNITAPGSYSSATRGGFVGGGAYIRSPVKPINLASFDAPRINFGCGGLDFYGGSFSFINAQQFANMIRYIISNAAGLLFQAALQQISTGLASISEKFSKMMQDINSMMANTCAVATQTIKAVTDPTAAGSALDQATSTLAGDLGDIKDSFSHLISSPDQKNADMKATEPFNPSAGNLTWKALKRSQSQDLVGIVGYLDANDTSGDNARLLMMAMLGTEVVTANMDNPPSCNNSYGQGGSCGSTPTSRGYQYPQIIKLSSLINADNLMTYNCSGPVASGDSSVTDTNSCLVLTQTPWQFSGTKAYIQNMLWGDDTKVTAADIKAAVSSYSPDSPGPNSIIGKLKGQQALNQSEVSVLLMSGPLYNIIKETQHDWSVMPAITRYIEDYMSVALAESIGVATVNAAQQAWSGVHDVKMPAVVSQNIRELNADLRLLQKERMDLTDNILKAKKIADQARAAITQARPN